jgi:hypothetical protein
VTEPAPAADPRAAVAEVLRELQATRDEVARLRRSGRRTFRFVLFDVAITLGVFAAGAIGVHAADSASQANGAQLALCQAGNTSRAQQADLWEFLIHLSPPKTEQGKKLIATFEHHLHAVFAPRDCSRLGRSQ